ncbi:MBL fold metallo-hydrolase [Fulvivirgaceae bacterium BMA10]|uniref:MBL fold metallo-hydrolase n=1 Tax=Splendidivirga corallicola TaxID=3051826 RepID=A0ABT8KM59_9BACT|nr:MBL fold metallo-hydrolase [Fulvivirgaceae bacterium BMA10]
MKRLLPIAMGISFFFHISCSMAQDFSNVKIETVKVTDNIYMLKGRGGNIGVSAGEDGVMIIDDQYAPLADKIKSAIAEINSGAIKFVINTHWHGDHVGGNEIFGKAGSIIVAHDNVRKRMSTDQFMERFQRNVPASPKAALPIISFDKKITFHFNDDEITVFHGTSAHTDGDAVIYFHKGNTIHMGDAFVTYGYPFIDAGSGGSIVGEISFLEDVLKMINDDTKVIPGHGELSTKKDIVNFKKMLVDIKDKVAKGVASGKTINEVLAAEPTKQYDASWNNGFIKSEDFIKMIYQELKAD